MQEARHRWGEADLHNNELISQLEQRERQLNERTELVPDGHRTSTQSALPVSDYARRKKRIKAQKQARRAGR